MCQLYVQGPYSHAVLMWEWRKHTQVILMQKQAAWQAMQLGQSCHTCALRVELHRRADQRHVRRYALHVPDNLPLHAAAPLLCAGITVYSPMMHYGLNKPGMKLGVVGLGGLGHMAVKLGKVCAATGNKHHAH